MDQISRTVLNIAFHTSEQRPSGHLFTKLFLRPLRMCRSQLEPTSFFGPDWQDRKQSPDVWQGSLHAARRSSSRREAQFGRSGWGSVFSFQAETSLCLVHHPSADSHNSIRFSSEIFYHTESMVFKRARSPSFVMRGSPRSLAVATMILSWSSVTSFVSII